MANMGKYGPETPAEQERRDWFNHLAVARLLIGMRKPKPKSIIRLNAEEDPSYCPYCLRCTKLVRMEKIEDFFWRCKCGAEHDEREHS